MVPSRTCVSVTVIDTRTERERTLVSIRSWTLPSKGAGGAHMYQLSAIDEVDGALALMLAGVGAPFVM